MATSPATAVKPAPAPPPQAPADPLTAYYRSVRQMNLQLAKDRYKQGFKVMDITQFLAERLPGEWPTGSNIDQKRKEPPLPGRRG